MLLLKSQQKKILGKSKFYSEDNDESLINIQVKVKNFYYSLRDSLTLDDFKFRWNIFKGSLNKNKCSNF